ncbi:MAG: sulfite reductase subunit beta, partial [Pseudomonadota bacterium]
HTLKIAEHVVTVQRDWGNRVNRKNAKTKYTLDRVGSDVFKAEVERRAGVTFEPSRPYEFTSRGDRFGWVKGVDGKHHLTLYILSGRILDYPNRPLKTGLRRIAEIHQGDFRMTANQNLVIAGVPADQKSRIEQIARDHGLIDDFMTPQLKNSMACVALPTCPLAMAEAERFLPHLVQRVQGLLNKHNIPQDHIILRVVGCPNGCGRAMLAEAGLVGKGPGKYNLYLGGNLVGTRVPKLHKENVGEDIIIDELDALIGRWARERNTDECFGDFVIRQGIVAEVKVSKTDFHA